MKRRYGFVSNSSSSSFIIGSKGELTKEKLFKFLSSGLNLPKDSFVWNLVNGAAETFKDNAKQVTVDDLDDDPYASDEWIQDSDYYKRIRKILDSKMRLYTGGVSTDTDDSMEQYLVDAEFDYESDDLIIWKEGGF